MTPKVVCIGYDFSLLLGTLKLGDTTRNEATRQKAEKLCSLVLRCVGFAGKKWRGGAALGQRVGAANQL